MSGSHTGSAGLYGRVITLAMCVNVNGGPDKGDRDLSKLAPVESILD